MNNRDFAIVIQGPIISSGNTGSGNHIKEFNCVENIKKLISTSRHLVKGYVVSTWKSSIPFQLDDDIIVLNLDDPGPNSIIGNDMPSNELRQSFGCLSGINKAIEEFNPTYILKIRTDQFIDLTLLINHILSVDNQIDSYKKVGQSGFLYFPNMLSWSPYSVGDFFIGGHSGDMQSFFNAQVEMSKHTFGYDFSWLHSDIILRHAFRNLKSMLQFPDEYYFPNITPSLRLHLLHQKFPIKFHPEILTLWSIILQNSVSFFPKSISESLIWRGSKMNFEKHTMGEFYEEWKNAYPNFKSWLCNLNPNLFLNKRQVSFIDKNLHFLPEKLLEIRHSRQFWRRHLYRLFRIFFSIFCGLYSKEMITPTKKIKDKLFKSFHLSNTLNK